jgi:integrase
MGNVAHRPDRHQMFTLVSGDETGGTVIDPVASYLAWCVEGRRSDDTIRLYRSVLRRFEAEHPDVLAVTAADVTAWLTGGHWAAATVASYRKSLAGFFRWASEWADLIDRSPMTRVQRAHVPQGIPRPVPRHDLERVLAAADTLMRCWLLLACDAGLRRAEISRVHRDDIVGRRIVITGKGRHQRTVPLSSRLQAALAVPRPCPDGRLWNATRDTVGQRVAKFLRAHGIDATCHMLRHTFATTVYRTSRDIRQTQVLLGHRSIATTQIYAAFDPDLDAVIDAMDRAA